MHSSNGFCGMVAAGMVLLWSSFVCAQSLTSPPNTRQPSAVPAIAGPLICDSSGQRCIAAAKSRAAVSPVAAPTAMPSPSKAAQNVPGSAASLSATESGISKQPATNIPRPMICDVSGQICTPAAALRGSAAMQHPLSPAIATQAASLTTSVPKQIPAKPDTGKAQLVEFRVQGHVVQSSVDGVTTHNPRAALTENPLDWALHAYKSQHRLEVYFRGHLYKTYHAVFGRSMATGAKLWEGDRRTPEGNYLIVRKHRSARFGWFLQLNYPNEQDHERFEQSRATHLIPASAHEGGEIGIHGTDSPYLNVADVNWTTGCISVDNSDINELAELLPVGALVVINP